MMNVLKELSYQEYQNYASFPMNDITQTADELVDLWTYADAVIAEKYHSCPAWSWEVRYIYKTPDGLYQHINIPVPMDNTYLVIVIDVKKCKIVGHYILVLG